MRWIAYRDAKEELFAHQRERLRRNHELLDAIVQDGYSGLDHMTAEELGREYEQVFGEPVRVALDRSTPGEDEGDVA
ncbi:hypothetical protein [Thiohalorhabdus methylotrophus]|uniref:Uncharacterized protein n=1 Tax=Thiohalorhabdus methylotrophus TaxID=3242694 RepID=A0ABV4TRX5_9GAMM